MSCSVIDRLNFQSLATYTSHLHNTILDGVKMLSKPIFSVLILAVAVLAPVVSAGGGSDKYDPYNHCGAPFCGSTGSTGNVAAAGALVRNSTADTANDQVGEKLPKM
jgi:hypothetical protein